MDTTKSKLRRNRVSRQDKPSLDLLARAKFTPATNKFVHHEVNDYRSLIKAKIQKLVDQAKPGSRAKERRKGRYLYPHKKSYPSEAEILKEIEHYLNQLITKDLTQLKNQEDEEDEEEKDPEEEVEVIVPEKERREPRARRGRQGAGFAEAPSALSSFLGGDLGLLQRLGQDEAHRRGAAQGNPFSLRFLPTRGLPVPGFPGVATNPLGGALPDPDKNPDPDAETIAASLQPKPIFPSQVPASGQRPPSTAPLFGGHSPRPQETRFPFAPSFPSVASLPREIKLRLLRDLIFSLT